MFYTASSVLLFIVILVMVLYHKTNWFRVDGFNDRRLANNTPYYKSEDGWYLSIRTKDGKAFNAPRPNNSFLNYCLMYTHNDWDKFKKANDIFDSGDPMLRNIDLKTYNWIASHESVPFYYGRMDTAIRGTDIPKNITGYVTLELPFKYRYGVFAHLNITNNRSTVNMQVNGYIEHHNMDRTFNLVV
jgi:hypothetical protein